MTQQIFEKYDLAILVIDELYKEANADIPNPLSSVPNLNKVERTFVFWALLRKNFSPDEDRALINLLVREAHKMDQEHRNWFADEVTRQVKRPSGKPLKAEGLLKAGIALAVQKAKSSKDMKPKQAINYVSKKYDLHPDNVHTAYYSRSAKKLY